ncbi:MAG: YIP1 family protein [Eubacteriales bacterium]
MKKLQRILILIFCLTLVLGALPVSAAKSYQTYIYDEEGFAMDSPDAYTPYKVLNSRDIGLKVLGYVPIDSPQDMTVDSEGNLYIVDTTNNRIVACDSNYKGKFVIDKFVNEWGIDDSLASPKGVFVNDTEIYVADTENNRLVVFDKTGKFDRIIYEPEGDVFPETHIYKPVACAVDKSGRIYVVSSTTNMGVIAMNSAGQFQGFVGAQKAAVDPFEMFWRNFQTKEQRKQSIRFVATEYNNITIDADGFVYVTTSSIEENAQQNAINTKSRAGDYAPVKKLNPAGQDIMKRTGFYPPSGEVWVIMGQMGSNTIYGASKIIDVALGPNGTWSIIDEKRQKVYTYDEEGKLLYIFGDEGTQLGNLRSIQAIQYSGSDILLLDKSEDSITIYKRTEYGDIIDNAIKNHRERRYDEAVVDWKEILKRNNNFDMGYVGIAKSLYRDGKYQESMKQYEYANNTKGYSDSFKEYRKLWIEKYVIVIPISIIVIAVLIGMFFKNAAKVNKRDQIRKDRKLKLSSHLLYGFHIIFHPFDGFWDMKKEKRGSMGAALIYLALACATFIYKALGTGYIFNVYGVYSDFTAEAIGVIVPVLLWTVANWCLTTLFDGEGSMKDIFMVTCYSTIPITILMVPATLLTNIITFEEFALVNMLNQLAFIWLGFLLFTGTMVIHDYTLGKNVLTSLSTLVGMMFIMFVGVLFSGLIMKIVSFFTNIYVEIAYRI